MRLVLYVLQCVLVHTLLISPTDYSEAGSNGCREEEVFKKCGKMKGTCYASKCRYIPQTCSYECHSREDMAIENKRFSRDIRSISRSPTVVFQCTMSGEWVPVSAHDVVCKRQRTVHIVRDKFHHIKRLNDIAWTLLKASYKYLGLSTYYQRADVSLPGFSKFMADLWQKHATLAQEVFQYLNKRGGYVKLYDIPATPVMITARSHLALRGLSHANGMSRELNKELLDFRRRVVRKHGKMDPHLKPFLEELIGICVKNIYQTSRLINKLQSFDSEEIGIAEYIMDRQLQAKGNSSIEL